MQRAQKGKLLFDAKENDYVIFNGNRSLLSDNLYFLMRKQVEVIVRDHNENIIYYGKGKLDRKWVGGRIQKYCVGGKDDFDDVLSDRVDCVVHIEVNRIKREVKESVL